MHCSKEVQEHFEHRSQWGKATLDTDMEKGEKMGMKMINLERAEFKDTTQIKVEQ